MTQRPFKVLGIQQIAIVLYQMLTGRKPFLEDDSRTVMQKIRLDRYESPKRIGVNVPRKLERIMARCMQKMPANRYPTTQALIDDLSEFLASRLHVNYNARLVMYLEEIGVMTTEQADRVLSGVAPRMIRNGRKDKSFLLDIARTQAILAALLLGSGLGVQIASGRWSNPRDGSLPAAVEPEGAGFLSVRADPWAHVFVDGVHVLTTPSDRAVPLQPGKHYVKYVNPYFTSVEHEIIIEPGVKVVDRAELTEPLAEAEVNQTP